MSPENQSFVSDFIQAVAGSSLVAMAAWGAAGGATSGLLIKVSRWELARHIVIGALVAAGLGALALPVVLWAMHLPADAIAPGLGGAAGSSTYLAGVILPSFLEVFLTRMKRGSLPTDKDEPDA